MRHSRRLLFSTVGTLLLVPESVQVVVCSLPVNVPGVVCVRHRGGVARPRGKTAVVGEGGRRNLGGVRLVVVQGEVVVEALIRSGF